MSGNDNEASFSKAFKRTYWRSPGAFRRELRDGIRIGNLVTSLRLGHSD
jgi:hypothetical protein